MLVICGNLPMMQNSAGLHMHDYLKFDSMVNVFDRKGAQLPDRKSLRFISTPKPCTSSCFLRKGSSLK